MEMLIVIAIIAVLVAIAIPIFTTQLEKSREATDAANIRSAYAEVAATALESPNDDHSATVTKVQTQDGWEGDAPNIAGAQMTDDQGGSGTIEIAYTADDGKIKIGGIEATTGYNVS